MNRNLTNIIVWRIGAIIQLYFTCVNITESFFCLFDPNIWHILLYYISCHKPFNSEGKFITPFSGSFNSEGNSRKTQPTSLFEAMLKFSVKHNSDRSCSEIINFLRIFCIDLKICRKKEAWLHGAKNNPKKETRPFVSGS